MIQLDPPYQSITQLPVLCGPACLEMVITRHGIWQDQEVIAQALGTYVRRTETDRYRLPHPTAAPTDYSLLGIRLIDLDTNLNRIANERGWPLSFQLHRLSAIPDLRALLVRELTQNHDVVINFWLNESREQRKNVGHFVLAESIDEATGIVTVVDPDPDAPNPRWQIPTYELEILMGSQWDGADRGVVIVCPVLD